MRAISKITKAKGLVEWLKWYSTCIARVRPYVQPPEPQKKKKKKKGNDSTLIVK
jgi:hypothetical protein